VSPEAQARYLFNDAALPIVPVAAPVGTPAPDLYEFTLSDPIVLNGAYWSLPAGALLGSSSVGVRCANAAGDYANQLLAYTPPLTAPTGSTISFWCRSTMTAVSLGAGSESLEFSVDMWVGSFDPLETYSVSTRVLINDVGVLLSDFRVQINGSSFLSSGTPPTNGAWFNVTVTNDAVLGVSVYLDGVLVSSSAFPETGGYSHLRTVNAVGMRAAVGGRVDPALQGDIQDVRLIGRALTAGEVAALFAAGPGGADPLAPPPAFTPVSPLPPPLPPPTPTPPYPPPTPPSPRYAAPAPNPGNTCVQVLFTCQYLAGVATWVQTSAACVPNAQCAPQSLVVDSDLLYFEQQGGCPLNVLPSPLPAVPPIASPYPYLLNPLQPLVTIPAPCAPAPFDGCLKTTHSCQCMSGGPNSTPVWVLDSAVCVPGTQCLGVTGPNPDAQGAYRQEHPSACYLGETVPPGSIVVPPVAPDCCRCCKDWSATCAGGVWTVTRSAEACVQPTSCAPTAWQSAQPDSCAMTRRTQGTTACATQAACANNVDQPPNPTPALTVPPCCAP
jgi:hypothetical protein